MKRAFMGSQDAADSLPEEFRRNMDEHVCTILIEANKVMDLCGRFYCNTANFSDGKIDVMIRMRSEEKKQ